MPTTITATYRSYAIFTIPKKYRHLPEDRFEVIRCVLHIHTDSGKVVKIDPRSDPQDSIDWKRGSEIAFDEDDPESEDEEEVKSEDDEGEGDSE
jgi:hypothetical protein